MAKDGAAKRGEREVPGRGAVKRRGLLAGAAALIAAALASRGNPGVEAQAPITKRVLYDMQSPDVWFEDFGEGRLVNGRAEIAVAADYAAAVDTAAYHVFLTSHDPASKGLAVAARQADRFVVQEHAGGTSNLTFSWRMVARPKGAKSDRMPTLTIPVIKVPDPSTFPAPPVPTLPSPRPENP